MSNTKSDSIFRKRIRKFKSIKRGYYSLIILMSLYLISVLAPFLINKTALMVCYANNSYDLGEHFSDVNNNQVWDDGEIFTDEHNYYFPVFGKYYEANFFGQDSIMGKKKFGSPHYRILKENFNKQNNGNYVIMPLYPFA